MKLGLEGKIAIITGASRGIGFACATEFLNEGAKVVLVSQDAARNAAATKSLAATASERVVGVAADLQDPAAMDQVVARTLKAYGGIDILVNCGAAVVDDDFFNLSDDGFAGLFENKLNGTAGLIRRVVPSMRERRWGRIINFSGGAARTPRSARIGVGLNNAAVLTLTKAMATELAKDNILVNAILPQGIASERLAQSMTAATADTPVRKVTNPLGRAGTSEEVSGLVAFLASERASFITGAAFTIDGGAYPSI
jgi:NAD(P)-dependent dehydrogenase (short-subunit alcohol dehydrogenase family)